MFPGLGQLYNRELKKSLILIVGSMLAALSVLVGIGLVLYPAVWLYAIYDAYRTAERQGTATASSEEDGATSSTEPTAETDDRIE